MNKIIMTLGSVLVLVSLLVCGCAPAAEEAAPLQACTVGIDGIYTGFGGKESTLKTVVFTISNPNDYEVTVNTMEYMLTADGRPVGATQITDNIYIPANTEIKMERGFVVGFQNIIVQFFLGEAIPIAQASMKAVPVYKSLGGQLAVPALQPVWDAAPGTPPLFEADGMLYMSTTSGETMEVEFTTSWKAAE